MAQATSGIDTPRRDGVQFGDPVAANTVIYTGTLTALDDDGNAVPATSDGKAVRGVAEHDVDNTGGAAGDRQVSVRKSVYRFDGAGFTRADIGALAYVVDNQTIAKDGTALAGQVVDVEASGIWIDLTHQ